MQKRFSPSGLFIKCAYGLQALFAKLDNRCLFCASEQCEVVFVKSALIDICHCKECGLYWTNPVFKFDAFYDHWDSETEIVTNLDTGNLASLLATSFKGSGRDYKDLFLWLKEHHPQGETLFEFGCSWGYLLYQAEKFGFRATGVDISRKRSEFGRKYLGVNIYCDMDKLIKEGRKFDIIFTTNTLEHLGGGLATIFDSFFSLLASKGVMIIDVPMLVFKRGNDAFRSMGAAHPLGFTEEFFTKSLSRYNLKIDLYPGLWGGLLNDNKPPRESWENLAVLARRKD